MMKADSWVLCHLGRRLKLGSDHGVVKLGSDQAVGILRFDHGRR